MKSNFNFYAITGSNGFGIVKTWYECQKCQKYFKKFKVKGFIASFDAYNWIAESFRDDYDIDIEEHCNLEYLMEKHDLYFFRKGREV